MRYVKPIVVLLAMLFFIPIVTFAGDISGGGDPTTNGGGAMNTLEDIYNLINLGTTKVPRTTIFAEPTAGPVATGHTLTQVYDRAKTSSRPAKTGQIICYNGDVIADCTGTGQDGATLKGVTWPSPRFNDNSDGTVTDNLTGLIWLKVANYNSTSTRGTATWANALAFCNALASGQCDLTDGSTAGQWRLPNLRELQSLIDYGRSPALPVDHFFTDVQNGGYWSSTTAAVDGTRAWFVVLSDGDVGYNGKPADYYVWPVRGGQS